MESWLAWARGPFFLFSFAFMTLGLIRHGILTVLETRRAVLRAGDRDIPYRRIAVDTLKWLFPVGKIGNRLLYSLTSFTFHVAILIVPVFLVGHVALWARGIGLSWPAIPNGAADVLTIVAVLTAGALVVQRAAAKTTRSLSRFQDFVIPFVVAAPFVSGFFVMHPSLNPFSWEAMLLIHVMSGNLLFMLIPVTKLSHIALIPSVHLVSEVAWHWPPDAGSRLAASWGKEEEPV